MGRFKQIYLMESVKESKQNSLGLIHVSFNHYKDSQGNFYEWDDEKNEFIKGSIENNDLVKISSKINSDIEFKEHIDKLSFLTIPKEYKKVSIEEVSVIKDDSGKVRDGARGIYIQGSDNSIHIKLPIDISTLYHEIGHFLDYGGSYESKTKYSSSHEFSKLIKKVNSMPTIKKLQDINSNGFYELFDGEKVIMDEKMTNYVRYLMKPDEIFARLFAQYICSKNSYSMDYYESIPKQWDIKEFKEIETYMDSMFKRMGWTK